MTAGRHTSEQRAPGNRLERTLRVGLRAFGVRSRLVETEVAGHHVYELAGRGALPPVVLLHGLADSATSSLPMLPHLSACARRVLIVEAAGHGLSHHARGEYSAARHLASMAAALDALVDEPALLVGNSLGGATALHYARVRPDRVRALFLTSPGGAPCDAETTAALRATFTMRTTKEAYAFLARVAVRRRVYAPLVAPLAARVLRARAASPAVLDILRTFQTEHLSPEELGALAMPVMLVWGQGERILPRVALEYFRSHLPSHAVIVEAEGFGHCPHLDDPQRLARTITAFARQLG